MSGVTSLVSHAVGLPLNGGSYNAESPLISADGSAVVFSSRSVNLVANSGSTGKFPHSHVYAFETATGLISLVDHTTTDNVTPGNGKSYHADVSADGRFVVYWSYATNLVASGAAGKGDAYRFDRQSGTSISLSQSGNGFTGPSAISDDGRWITLVSSATNLISGATTSGTQVLLCDADTGTLAMVSHVPGNALVAGNGTSTVANISGDGTAVVFLSQATDLVAGFSDGNGAAEYDLYTFDRPSGAVSLASHSWAAAAISANAGAAIALPQVSDDGRFVVFPSQSTDLVSGFVDNDGTGVEVGPDLGYDVFRFDRIAGKSQLVSSSVAGATQTGNRGAFSAAMNADGTYVAYTTAAGNVIAGLTDTNGHDDVYGRDVVSSNASLVSRRFGVPALSAGGGSEWAQVSADARYVVFTDTATNLVPGQMDTEQTQDVFLTDRQTQTTWMVSHSASGAATAANNESGIPVISADGRYVAYCSFATDLIDGFVDGNGPRLSMVTGGMDVFLFDRVTATNTLVSHKGGSPNTGGNSISGTFSPFPDYLLTISDDGRYVGYMSLANDLVSGFADNNGTSVSNHKGGDVYVYDRVTGGNEVVSHTPGAPLNGGNGNSYAPSISGDGRYVAYWSSGNSMVAGMPPGSGREVFVYDRQTGTTALVSHAAGSATTPGNGGSNNPAISRDGKYVVFQSAANTLVTGGSDPNNLNDVFLYDRQTGTNTLVSHRFDSAVSAGSMSSSIDTEDRSMNDTVISSDGRFVMFQSQAQNLVSGFVDGNGQDTISALASIASDVYLFDRLTGTNTLISRTAASATSGGNRTSAFGSLSGDGRFLTFVSQSSNLAAAGTRASDSYNVFLYDRLAGTLSLVSQSITGVTLTSSQLSFLPTLSRDGSAAIYVSNADNLVAGDFNSFADVFAYVTPPPRVQSVTINDGSPQRSTVRSLTVTFDQPVFFAGSPAAAFALTSQAGSVQLAAGSMVGNSLTLTFSGPLTQFASLIDGKYTLTVLANQVSNVGPLDGNGDGVGGDNYTFGFHRLFGDADGDADVDATDFGAFRQAFGTAGVAFDFDNDGDVDASDFGQFRQRFGMSL